MDITHPTSDIGHPTLEIQHPKTRNRNNSLKDIRP